MCVLCLVAQSCLTFCNPMDCSLPGSSVCGDSPGKNTGVGCRAFFQGVFPTQGSNPGLPHCRWILYQLSHKGSPGALEWVAYPFSSGSSWPRNWTEVSCIARGIFVNWAIGEAHSPRLSDAPPEFSIVAVSIYSLTSNAGGFPFHTFFSIYCFLWWWPFWQVWGNVLL